MTSSMLQVGMFQDSEGGTRVWWPLVVPVLTTQHYAARLGLGERTPGLHMFTHESRFTLSTCDIREQIQWRCAPLILLSNVHFTMTINNNKYNTAMFSPHNPKIGFREGLFHVFIRATVSLVGDTVGLKLLPANLHLHTRAYPQPSQLSVHCYPYSPKKSGHIFFVMFRSI